MRWRWRILIGLAVLPVLAAVVLAVAIDSAPVRGWLAATVAQAASTPGEMEVAIEDLGPGLPGGINIGAVTLADSEGVWLRLEDIALDWNPWALLGGTVAVEELTVASVALLREPLPGPQTPEPEPAVQEPFALPEPPGIAIEIARLEIPSIAIDASVMGTAAHYRLDGSADLGAGGAGQLVLDLDRLDGPKGVFALRFDVDLPADDLAIDAQFSEGEDGLLVHLLDIAPYPAVSATLAARGSVDAWQGTFSMVLSEMADADATFSVTRGQDGYGVDASGTLHPGGLLDAETARLVGETVTWSARASLEGERLEIAAAEVAVDPATVQVKGSVMLDTMALDLAVAAEGTQTPPLVALAAPLRLAGWTLAGHLAGTPEAPSLTAKLTVDEPAAEGMAARQAVLDLSAARADAAADWSVEAELAVADPDLGDDLANAQVGTAPRLILRGSVGAAFETVDIADLQLTLAAGHLQAGLALDTRDGAIDLRGLRADLPLAPLSDLAGLDLGGRLAVAGDISATAWGENADGSLRLEASDLTTGQAMLDAIAGPTPGLTLSVSGGTQHLVVDEVVLALPIWEPQGSFDIDLAAGTLEGRLSGPFRTTPALAAQLDPALAASGTLGVVASGPLAAPRMDVRLTVARGAYAGLALDGAVVDLREIDLASGLTMAVRASLPAGGQTLTAQTAIAIDADFAAMTIRDLRLAGPGIDAGGGLDLDLASSLIEGRVAGRLTDLEALAGAFALGAMKGVGVFEASFTPTGDGQTIEAKTWIEGVSALGVGISEFALAATVTDALATPVLDVRGSFAGVDLAGMTTADKALLRANGGLDDLEISLQARGTGGPGWNFDTAARLNLGEGGTSVTLASLELTSGDHRVATSQALNVTMNEDGIVTDTLVLTIDGGSLNLSVDMGDEHIRGNLKIAGVPLSVLEMIDPALAMQGQLDGSAAFDVDPTDGQATASLSGSGLKLPEATIDEEASLTLDATWRASRLAVTVDIDGIEGLDGALKAEWPITFDPRSGAVEVPRQEKVAASFELKGDIAKLWQHLPISDQILSGDIDLQLTASGVAADPVVQGQVQLDHGRYENLEWGTIVDDIAVEASSTQDGGLQLAVNANDGGSGKIAMTGRADLSTLGRLLLDAKLTLDNAHLVRRDDAKVVAAGDMTFKGSLAGGDIVGRFRTVEVDINVAQSLPGSVTVLNAQDVFRDDGQERGGGAMDPWQANLDIVIEMPNKVRVHGRGLDSEWAGKITVAGTLDDPQVSADLNLVRGNLDLLGRRLALTSGEVSLVPADNGDPRFDVVAAMDSGDVSGQLEVSGRLSAPQLKVSTVPSLPEDEALARLMFGKGAGSLSGIEALQLASAIGEITGATGSGSGIVDRFRDTLGVDVLEVGTDNAGNMTVGAGRYLSDGVYVGVQQGAAANSSGVVVNIELTDSLSLETEAGADASGSVGIDWSWDY